MEKQKFADFIWKLLRAGGWFPLAVFFGNWFLKYIVHIHHYIRRADLPIHVVGGFSIAYFISKVYRLLPRDSTDRRSREVLLELLLMVSLTATMALMWEIAEFSVDLVLHTSVQESLLNTMLDLAMGLIGAAIMVVVRAWQLRASFADLKAVVLEMSG